MWQYNGKTIREGKAWTDANGIQHPANWHIWTRQEKEDIGMVEIIPQTPPDSRFYKWSQNPDGTITSTPKELEDRNEVDENGDPRLDEDGVQIVRLGLKSVHIAQTKSTQGSLLTLTDWAVIRKNDTGEAIPAAIQTYRDAVRSAATTIEGRITACTTLDQFINLFEIPLDDDEVPTGNAPIYDWPEALN